MLTSYTSTTPCQWTARQRFWKTYRVVTENAYYPDHELVSIPNHPDLIRQLSQPLWFKPKGQIIVESKAQMAARGLKSPDYADALIMFLWQGFDSYSPDWIGSLNSKRIYGQKAWF